ALLPYTTLFRSRRLDVQTDKGGSRTILTFAAGFSDRADHRISRAQVARIQGGDRTRFAPEAPCQDRNTRARQSELGRPGLTVPCPQHHGFDAVSSAYACA